MASIRFQGFPPASGLGYPAKPSRGPGGPLPFTPSTQFRTTALPEASKGAPRANDMSVQKSDDSSAPVLAIHSLKHLELGRVLKGVKILTRSLCVALCCLCGLAANHAGDDSASTLHTVLERHAQFWKAYNACDTATFRNFFTDDVEFYHDTGGPTIGLEPLVSELKTHLCGTNGWRLRREAVAGTEKAFLLRKGADIYGAIVTGEHLFYVIPPGKPEFLDGHARFTHLFLKRGNDFKMARILSFDHQAANAEKK
jgi:hypothetical protein